MYNVFTDFHHASLLQSFILLFENRLGGKVYRPIGLEWAERGFWHVFDHPFTREQFLSTTLGVVTPPPQMYPDGTRPVNVVAKIEDGIYYCQDIDSNYYNKAITFDKFMSMPFDIVIASIPQHIQPFRKLCELHHNHPKLIYQVGNAWTIEAGLAPNIMASAIISGVPDNVHFISYHQEFDLNKFYPDDQPMDKTISSFINCFNVEQHFTADWQFFQEFERSMPTWIFKSFGGQCRDGACHGTYHLANAMRASKFIWHVKAGGDGYGHCLFNSAACGRPIIVKKQYYQGKLGEKLMIDGQTCIAIDGLGFGEIQNKINYFNEPDHYQTICKNVYNNFKAQVNFDQEAESLKIFLSNLK
jgi:hypothetical protein